METKNVKKEAAVANSFLLRNPGTGTEIICRKHN